MENLSQRQFFNKLIPKSEEVPETALLTEATGEVVEQPILSRRLFLQFLGAMGAAVTLAQTGINTAEAKESQENEDVTMNESDGVKDQETRVKNLSHNTAGPETTNEERENLYTETVLEQSLMMGAKELANAIFKALKIEHGNKSLSEKKVLEWLKNKPLEGLIKNGILNPVIEEALFRALPSGFIHNEDKFHRWDIGIPMSAVFALAHNSGQDETGEFVFKKSVPISQFMGGLFYWYLMREKGYSHATLAHSINNIVPFAVGALLFKIYPEEKAERLAKKLFGMKEGG